MNAMNLSLRRYRRPKPEVQGRHLKVMRLTAVIEDPRPETLLARSQQAFR
jgi:hypothetical protein